MIFRTKTGSVYHIDEKRNRVRRLSSIDYNKNIQIGHAWVVYVSTFIYGSANDFGIAFDWDGNGDITATSSVIESISDDGVMAGITYGDNANEDNT